MKADCPLLPHFLLKRLAPLCWTFRKNKYVRLAETAHTHWLVTFPDSFNFTPGPFYRCLGADWQCGRQRRRPSQGRGPPAVGG